MSQVKVTRAIQQSLEMEFKARDIKHGTWVRIGWSDSEPTVGLVLRYTCGSKKDGSYPKNYKGDRSIEVYLPDAVDQVYARDRIVHTQIEEIIGALVVPE